MNESSNRGLRPERSALLRQVIARHQPELDQRAATIGILPLSDEEREILREVITTEFLATGLEGNDEPNARGLELEGLIDDLGHC
jgi:hypothetical protein